MGKEQNKQPKTIQASFEVKQPQQKTKVSPDLNKDTYYSMTKENFFYLQNLLHETNRYGNNNYHKFSEKLFTSATIILGFVPIILSLLEDPILDSQKWFLSLGIFGALFSMVFGYIDHYVEKKFWEDMTNMFDKQTRCFDSTLSKMRDRPDKTFQLHRETIIHIEGMNQCYKTESKVWAQITQFILLLLSMVSLIVCYLITLSQ